jgi:hypothetical protein
MRAVPFHDLKGARRDREERLGQPEEERAQARIPPSGRLRGAGGKGHGDAGDAGKLAQVVPVAGESEALEPGEIGYRGQILGPADQDPVLAKRERERVLRQRVGPGVAGRESLGCMHSFRCSFAKALP